MATDLGTVRATHTKKPLRIKMFKIPTDTQTTIYDQAILVFDFLTFQSHKVIKKYWTFYNISIFTNTWISQVPNCYLVEGREVKKSMYMFLLLDVHLGVWERDFFHVPPFYPNSTLSLPLTFYCPFCFETAWVMTSRWCCFAWLLD